MAFYENFLVAAPFLNKKCNLSKLLSFAVFANVSLLNGGFSRIPIKTKSDLSNSL